MAVLDSYEDLFRLSFNHRGKKGPAIPKASLTRAGQGAETIRTGAGGYKAALRRTVTRTPEVMVKISGGAKTAGGIGAHLAYIARADAHAEKQGKTPVEIEDEEGNRYKGREDVAEVMERWKNGRHPLQRGGEKAPKQVFNIVLSMPPGTSRAGVTKAARQFAKEQFKDHEYVFAAHDDEAHPHVHLCVKAVNHEGRRLNPRKADLQKWRQHFAARLRDEGIAANATPRRTRGVVQKAAKQPILHMDKEYRDGQRKRPSKATIGQSQMLRDATKEGHYLYERKNDSGQRIRVSENPFSQQITDSRRRTLDAYREIAQDLARSANVKDQQLAQAIGQFVASMPPVKTHLETHFDTRYGVDSSFRPVMPAAGKTQQDRETSQSNEPNKVR